MTKEEAQRFLAALQVISDEHGIVIAGCGCCGSPWLEKQAGAAYSLSTKFLKNERVSHPSIGLCRDEEKGGKEN